MPLLQIAQVMTFADSFVYQLCTLHIFHKVVPMDRWVSTVWLAIFLFLILKGHHHKRSMKQFSVNNFFTYYFFCIFVFFFASAAPQRPTCSFMPTLLALQQGMTCPCRLERCWIRTWDCRFYSLQCTTNKPPHVVAQSTNESTLTG